MCRKCIHKVSGEEYAVKVGTVPFQKSLENHEGTWRG